MVAKVQEIVNLPFQSYLKPKIFARELLLETPGFAKEDASDIAATLSGDGEAYRRLVLRYQGIISQQMSRFSRDASVREELVHDIFVEAYMSLRSYRGTAPWLHWLRKVAVRVGYRYWRSRKSLVNGSLCLKMLGNIFAGRFQTRWKALQRRKLFMLCLRNLRQLIVWF
jgi:DNA-directed RNA polymerase specialized sigma24 family protein